jgi:hypothetical protein
MNLWMDPLGDLLTTCPIQTGWEFTMEPDPSGQFGFIDDPDPQFGNSLGWTRTRSDGPEPLLTQVVILPGVLLVQWAIISKFVLWTLTPKTDIPLEMM